MSIFKACDIRGIYGQDLTADGAYRIGRAMGAEAGGRSAVVAGDIRLSTPALQERVIAGLVESGCQVTDIGIAPTPVMYFARHHLGAFLGLMVTASHNPPEYNGMKFTLGPNPVTPAQVSRIRDRVERKDFTHGNGSVRQIDVLGDYYDYLSAMLGYEKTPHPKSIVVDAGNGCYSESAPKFLESLGHRVIRLNCVPDGNFPGRPPDPTLPGSLEGTRKAVIEAGADFGASFDGDGDRVIFLDDLGRTISGDAAIVLLARHLLHDSDAKKVVHDIKCSRIVPEEIEKAGGIPVVERSGHAFIKARLINEQALFAGEISGHFFYGLLEGGDDALFSICKMVELLGACEETRHGKHAVRLSELYDEIPRYCITPDIRVPYAASDKEEVLQKIRDAHNGHDRVTNIDGVRVDFEDGWGIARMSVTEPLLTFRFEAESEDKLTSIVDRFLSPVPDVDRAVRQKLRELMK